jgi:hypothetical protein
MAAPSSAASLGTLITQGIVAVGGFAGLAATINAIFSRRRTRAEAGGMDAAAAAVISDTAASQVQRMDARMAAQESRIAEQGARVDNLEDEVRELRRGKAEAERREEDLLATLDDYAEWCSLATRTLSEHGIVIAPPPNYAGQHRTRPPPEL